MNKILIIYYTKTGFTEKYAQWVREETNCELLPYSRRDTADFTAYDTIVYGGGVHAGAINGLKWFRKRMTELSGKRLVVFATGAMPPESPEPEKALKQNFSEEEWQKLKVFYLPSGLNYEKMGAVDRAMMAMFRSLMKKKEGEDSEAYRAVSASYDISSKEYLKPLLQYLKEN